MEPDDTLDEAQDVELEEVETEGQETDSESSPDTEEVQEKQTEPLFNEEQQKVFNEQIYKERGKRRASERELEALNNKIKNLEQQIPKEQRPAVPKEPDPFALSEADFQQQARLRDEAIARQAAYDTQQRIREQERQRVYQEQQNKEQELFNDKVATYTQRSVQLGISTEELQAAGNAVQHGMSPEVINYILEDDLGPVITKYLSQNFTELDNLRAMSPTQAAARIATHVRGKASALKPKVNAAPDPVNTPERAGKAPSAKAPKGAIFE